MLAVQVRLLAGRYVATEYNDRDRAEWPPHPMRLYAAAVAAWADTEHPDPAERAALEWWESLGAPDITCSTAGEVAERSVVTHYVPVNDATVLSRSADSYYGDLSAALGAQSPAADSGSARAIVKAERAEAKARTAAARAATGTGAPESALQVLPDQRIRQARTYPSVTPADEIVLYRWPHSEPTQDNVDILDAVLARVPRLGHSSSPVDVAVVAAPPTDPTYVPASSSGDLVLRTVGEGQLASLEDAYAAHRGREPRILASDSHHYRRPAAAGGGTVAHSVFESDDWIILVPKTRRPILAALSLTRALRAALMVHAVQPPPALLTGHREGAPGQATEPADDPHVAYLALPFVGGTHGDGSIQAVALVLPRAASAADRTAVHTAIGRWLDHRGQLTLGRHGVVDLEIATSSDLPRSAMPRTWARPSSSWSSATPVALDRHPGRLDAHDPERRDAALAEARASIRTACQNVGLPEPTQVNVRSDAPIRGTRPARAFPPFAVRGGSLRRFLVHVDLQFAAPVRGPVILGAGRFFGYGLMRPTDGDDRGRG